jgi:site-specific DNA-cytosine methylase
MRSVGIHVFAGGFSHGVQQVADVTDHLEVHGFGLETAKAMCNVNIHNSPAEDWPDVASDFAFGNPRCTGFSTVTAGYDDKIHGPFASCTRDIWEFMNYCTGRYPIFAWESVQQAYSTGRPLINMLVEKVAAQGYRVAHVFVNAASLGNAQRRKRYFFVAYDASKNFNIEVMKLPEYAPSLYDAIWHLRDRQDMTLTRLSTDEIESLPYLPNGWDLNMAAQYNCEKLPEKLQDTWLLRNSGMPFSMHCVKRLNWRNACPTIFSSAGRFIHPEHNRGLSHEELAAIMGLPIVPLGNDPVAQIAKGVCPCVGEWLATQAIHYHNDAWGEEDWEASYQGWCGEWKTAPANGKLEKVFNITSYLQTLQRPFTDETLPKHRFNVDPHTGDLINTWSSVKKSHRQHSGDTRLRSSINIDHDDLVDE